jgi:hypothetical protein
VFGRSFEAERFMLKRKESLMKKWYGPALLFAMLFLVGWTTFGQKKNQPKVTWEYKRVGHATETGEPELNQLGAQGWELVAVDQEGTVFYLKRPR